jgi:hypothetical protein
VPDGGSTQKCGLLRDRSMSASCDTRGSGSTPSSFVGSAGLSFSSLIVTPSARW